MLDRNQNTMFSPYVIFAVGDMRASQIFTLYMEMEHIPYKRLQGCWDGKSEVSFLVSLEDFEQRHLRHPWTDDQEAIMVLGSIDQRTGKRPVAVEYGGENGHWHVGGMFWTEVSAAEAKTHPGWTHDTETDTYWLVMNEGGEIVDLTRHDHGEETPDTFDAMDAVA